MQVFAAHPTPRLTVTELQPPPTWVAPPAAPWPVGSPPAVLLRAPPPAPLPALCVLTVLPPSAPNRPRAWPVALPLAGMKACASAFACMNIHFLSTVFFHYFLRASKQGCKPGGRAADRQGELASDPLQLCNIQQPQVATLPTAPALRSPPAPLRTATSGVPLLWLAGLLPPKAVAQAHWRRGPRCAAGLPLRAVAPAALHLPASPPPCRRRQGLKQDMWVTGISITTTSCNPRWRSSCGERYPRFATPATCDPGTRRPSGCAAALAFAPAWPSLAQPQR